jgi:hypothetical protein
MTMNASTFRKIVTVLGFVGVCAVGLLGCRGEDNEMTTSPAGAAGSSGNEGELPPSTPDGICQAIATFPGWGKLGIAPETDAEGHQTVWYVAIPARNDDEVNAIPSAGVPSEFTENVPEIQDSSADGGTPDPSQKYLCWEPAGAEIEWALVPGATLNQIIKTQAGATTPTWEAIVLLPVPSQLAESSLTFDGVHPVSDEAAAQLGF